MAEIVRCQALLPRPARPRIGAVTRKRVVFVTYPEITALDLVGPHEVLGVTGAYELVVAAKEADIFVRETPMNSSEEGS